MIEVSEVTKRYRAGNQEIVAVDNVSVLKSDPHLTSLENVMLPVVFSTEKKDMMETMEKAIRLLESLGLSDKTDAYPSQLSGGQQRRVAIARAFINNPEIILADEPTGDLDEDTEAEVIRFFKRLNEEKGITFIVVTHSLSIASEAKRILRMHNGKLYE